jgi:Phage terminase, small subunit
MVQQPTLIHDSRPSVPAHLAAAEAALFTEVVRNYRLRDTVSLRILEEACASLQRARTARETVDRDGMVFLDAREKPKQHPLLAVERDARAGALAAFRQLNLELPRSMVVK